MQKGDYEMETRIKYIRKQAGLTQTAFGEKIGVKGNTITNYENGLRNPTDAVILSICREFRVNEQWLRTGEGEPYVFPASDDYTEIVAKIDVKDPKARQAIIDYWNLTESDKELFWNFIERFIKKGEP